MSSRVDAAVTIEIPSLRNTADPNHGHGLIFAVAHNTTGQILQTIPDQMLGRFWTFLAVGANVQFGFVRKGNTPPTLVYNATSTMGVGEPTRGITALDSQPKDVYCPFDAIAVCYVSSTVPSAGQFEAYHSGRRTAASPR